jgi:hypothetical protein
MKYNATMRQYQFDELDSARLIGRIIDMDAARPTKAVFSLQKYNHDLLGKLLLDEDSGLLYVVHCIFWDPDTNSILAQRRPLDSDLPEIGDEEGYNISYIEDKVKSFEGELLRQSTFLADNWRPFDDSKIENKSKIIRSFKTSEVERFRSMYTMILEESLRRLVPDCSHASLRDIASQLCLLLESDDYFMFLELPAVANSNTPWWKVFRRVLSLISVLLRHEKQPEEARSLIEILQKKALLVSTSLCSWLDNVEPCYVVARRLSQEDKRARGCDQSNVRDSLAKLEKEDDLVWTGVPVSVDPGQTSVLLFVCVYIIVNRTLHSTDLSFLDSLLCRFD